MVTLFFGDLWSILSSAFLIAILAYTALTAVKYREAENWGRRILTLAIVGLMLCIFAVIRDDYAAALRGGAGLFSLGSAQINLAYVGAAVAGFSALSSILVRNQKYRKTMFFVLAVTILFKAGLIEISRMMM